MDSDLQHITLLVGDHSFKLNVPREQEKVYRDAAARVNAMLSRYRSEFPGLSREQYLAMVALHNATMDIEKKGLNDTAPFSARLKKSIDTLDEYLKQDNNP